MAINTKNILNNGEFKGVLQGYKIEKETVKAPYSKEGQFQQGDDVIQYRGYVSILTNPETGQFATVNVRNLQNTYNGDLDYTSRALEDLSTEGVDTYAKTKDITKTPTVTVKGVGLTDNFYVDKEGNVKEGVNIDLGFGRLYLNDPEEEPKFENSVLVNGIVRDIRPEIKNDEETGRALVDIYIPYTYGSEKKGNQVVRAFKATLVAGVMVDVDDEGEYEIDLGADLLDGADEVIGDSWKFGIEINNYYEEVEKPKVEEDTDRKRFGRKLRETVDTNRKRVSEFALTGLDQLVTPFDEDDIKDALRMREVAVEESKKKAGEKQNTPATSKPARGITRGRTETTATSTEGATTTSPLRGRGRRFS